MRRPGSGYHSRPVRRIQAVLTLVVLAVAGWAPASAAGPAPIRAPQCHLSGPLPDAACTPGAVNPAVTQATIHQTICVPGFTSTIRPPVGESNRLKRVAASDYGITDPISNYQGDHLIPLEVGGAPDDIANFWDEPHAASGQKDRLENLFHARVCSGAMLLVEAQRQMATDWFASYQAALG